MQFMTPNYAANDGDADAHLNVVVQGDEVRVLSTAGDWQVLAVRGAERTVTRLLDAIAIAQGKMPSARA